MCFEDRKKPALIVTILSVIVILCGVVMTIESIVFATQDDALSADLGSVSQSMGDFKNASMASLLIFSLLTIVTGIAGATCGCKPCAKGSICWPIIYGTLLLIVWLVTLIIGAIITGVSVSGPEALQTFCDGGEETSDGMRLEWVKEQIDIVDEAINGYSSHYMCSYDCPCDANEAS